MHCVANVLSRHMRQLETNLDTVDKEVKPIINNPGLTGESLRLYKIIYIMASLVN